MSAIVFLTKTDVLDCKLVLTALRNCRTITDTDCAGYFFEMKLIKYWVKNVGVAGCGEAFCNFQLEK